MMHRMFEGMQLEDWTRLSGLTGLTLRRVEESHHDTLAAVLPRLTTLRLLVLSPCWPQAAGKPANADTPLILVLALVDAAAHWWQFAKMQCTPAAHIRCLMLQIRSGWRACRG